MSDVASKPDKSPLSLQPEPATLPVPDTPVLASKSERRVELALQRAWHQLHFRLPRLVPSPYQFERDYLSSRDAKDNVASRVPPNERLRQVALWGVEIFGPAEVDGLHLAMKRLGWNDDRLFGFNADPSAWIDEQRTYGIGGGLNLGAIERPGKSRFVVPGRQAPLPDAVDYAKGWVYQLSPSITAVILCFVLTESASNDYQAEINLDRNTLREPVSYGYRSYNVEHVKRRAVDLTRIRTRTIVANWFATYLPGLFSCASDGNRLPTAELLTTTNQSLLVKKRESLEPNWIHLAVPVGHREVWKLKALDGLTLCWPGSQGDLRYHAIVNLQTTPFATKNSPLYGDQSDTTCTSFVDDHLQGILVNFAAIAALSEIQRRLRLIPSTVSLYTASRRDTVKCLEHIQQFFDTSVGIPAFTSELAAKSENTRSYWLDCEEFESIPRHVGDIPAKISEVLRSRTQLLASGAQILEKKTREHLEQLTTILSTRENIRTQATMKQVTFGAAIVSILSLGVTIMSVDKFSTYVNQQVEKFYKAK